MTTSVGRTVWPSARLCFTPRIRPVIPATLMIAVADGEPGRILEVCTFRRNGDAYSYVVQTASGREIWHADEVVLPAADAE